MPIATGEVRDRGYGRGGVLSFLLALGLLVGASVFAWLLLGGQVGDIFGGLAHAVSRAKP